MKPDFYLYLKSHLCQSFVISALFALVLGWGIGGFYKVELMSSEVRKQAKIERPASLIPFSMPESVSISVSGNASYFDEKISRMEMGPFNWIDMIYSVHFGIPFRSHSLSVARATNGKVFLVEGTVAKFGSIIFPTSINIFGLVLNSIVFFPVIAFAVAFFRTLLLMRKISQALCPHCRYPVSGLDRQGRCPECGKTAVEL